MSGLASEVKSHLGDMGILTNKWFIIIWGLTAVASVIWSFMCLGKGGTTGDKIAGLFIASIAGPLYWIYYYMNDAAGYCR